MRLGSVGRVEEGNRSDLESHPYCCVCGKEVLVFNDFDHEVTVTGWDPEFTADFISSSGLHHTTVREDCALDCSSAHLDPNFESQLAQHHIIDTV
jgi:hypothetical protein